MKNSMPKGKWCLKPLMPLPTPIVAAHPAKGKAVHMCAHTCRLTDLLQNGKRGGEVVAAHFPAESSLCS